MVGARESGLIACEAVEHRRMTTLGFLGYDYLIFEFEEPVGSLINNRRDPSAASIARRVRGRGP
jgi:hypothetical protein